MPSYFVHPGKKGRVKEYLKKLNDLLDNSTVKSGKFKLHDDEKLLDELATAVSCIPSIADIDVYIRYDNGRSLEAKLDLGVDPGHSSGWDADGAIKDILYFTQPNLFTNLKKYEQELSCLDECCPSGLTFAKLVKKLKNMKQPKLV